jgi:hypothetical protein
MYRNDDQQRCNNRNSKQPIRDHLIICLNVNSVADGSERAITYLTLWLKM